MTKTNPLDRQMYVVIKAKFSPTYINLQDFESDLQGMGFDEVEITEFDFVKEKPEDITNRDGEVGGK